MAPLPPAISLLPVDRACRARGLAPGPSFVAPEFAPPVASAFNKGRKFRLRDGRPRDCERLQLRRMRPLLVVENEGFVRARGTEHEASARDLGIARQGTRLDGRRVAGSEMSGKARRRVLKRLTRVRKGLVVHVLVEDRKQNEIGQLFSRIALAQAFQ